VPDSETWLPSLNQLERLESPNAHIRDNDVVCRAVDIEGPVNIEQLERALAALELRHPVLTCQITSGGLVPGRRLDGSRQSLGLAPQRSERQLNDNRSLDGRCFTISLAKLAPKRFRLSLTADHSIMDARSVSLVFRDLFNYYSGLHDSSDTGVDSTSTEPWTFGRWTSWERQHIDRRGQALHSFWREKLAGIGPFPEIQIPTLGQARKSGVRPTVFTLTFSREAQASLNDLALTADSHPFAVVSLLIKTTVLAVRMASEPQASYTVPAFGAFPNRLPREVLESVGGFANSAVIASQLHNRDTLMAAVKREAQEIFVASCHQDLPHALIVKALQPELYGVRYWGSLDQIPRYFNLDMPSAQDAPFDAPTGLRLRIVSPVPEIPRSGLRAIAKRGANWSIEIRYDPQVYSENVMGLLRTLWMYIVDSWLRNPESTLGAVVVAALRRSALELPSHPAK